MEIVEKGVKDDSSTNCHPVSGIKLPAHSGFKTEQGQLPLVNYNNRKWGSCGQPIITEMEYVQFSSPM